MTQRADLLLQILERLGAPLMAAVNAVARQPANEGAPAKDAERVAELLARSVQAGMALSETSGLRNGGDSVRLALTALAARLLGEHYRQTGKVPAEADIKRLTGALEAVLIFSDNFALAADNIARLENLAPGDILADESQVNIQYLGLFVPVVIAVARFPFGQPERKLAQDIAARLIAVAGEARQRAGTFPDRKAEKRAELQILRALVALYAACHGAETDRLMAMNAEARGQAQSMDAVWRAFDQGVTMLEILAGNIAPGADGGTASSGGPAPAAVVPPSPFTAQPAPPPPPEQKVAPEEQAGYNPMSFFKPPGKKGAEG